MAQPGGVAKLDAELEILKKRLQESGRQEDLIRVHGFDLGRRYYREGAYGKAIAFLQVQTCARAIHPGSSVYC